MGHYPVVVVQWMWVGMRLGKEGWLLASDYIGWWIVRSPGWRVTTDRTIEWKAGGIQKSHDGIWGRIIEYKQART